MLIVATVDLPTRRSSPGENQLASLDELFAYRQLLRDQHVGVLYVNRSRAAYANQIAAFLEQDRDFWFLKQQGTVNNLDERLLAFLEDSSGIGEPSVIRDLHADVMQLAERFIRFAECNQCELSLYARGLPTGVSYFTDPELCTPHYDDVACRMICTLVGPGTMYAPARFFRPEGLQVFAQQRRALLEAFTRTGDPMLLARMSGLHAEPPFVEPPGRPGQLAENTVALFGNLGAQQRPAARFWHWFPHSGARRLFLAIDRVEG